MLESKLVQVEENIKRNDIKQAAQIIQSVSDRITRHVVEEEARLMRVIMHNVNIMHEYLNEFVNNLSKEEEQIVFPLTLRAEAAN